MIGSVNSFKLNSIDNKQMVKLETNFSSVNIQKPSLVSFGANHVPTLIAQFAKDYNLKNANIKTPNTVNVNYAQAKNVNYKNNLRQMFQNNEAVIMAVVPRLMGAKDSNGDDYVSTKEVRGNLINSVKNYIN